MRPRSVNAARACANLCAGLAGSYCLANYLPSASASPVFNIQEMGLTGANYSYANSGGTYQYSGAQELNDAGQVIGYSSRFSASGGALGQDAWLFSDAVDQEIGLTGGIYSSPVSGGTFQFSNAMEINDAGEVIGDSWRLPFSTGTEFETRLGVDAWLFNGSTYQSLGLTGGNYSYVNSYGTFQSSNATQLNDAGQAIGVSSRYSSSGASLGQDAWYWNGVNTQQIGLTGLNYSYAVSGGTYQSSGAQQLDGAGQAIGYSYRFDSLGNSLGQDAWLFNGTSTQQIGLTGGNYSYAAAGGTYQSSSAQELNSAGQAIGDSNRYNASGTSLGQDVWIFNGTSTQQIGLTGVGYSYAASGGTYQYSGGQQLNNAGQSIGYSYRYNASGANLGYDAWLFNGASTAEIGLTGVNYTYTNAAGIFQSGAAQQLNNAGQVIGHADRYNASGGSLGQDAWLFNGSGTQQIGLTGANYSYAAAGGTYQSSGAQQLNDAGQVIGFSARYNSSGTSLGQDGWFFDSNTDTTTLLQFSVDSANSHTYTSPELLTANGVVLGAYTLYSGSTDLGNRVFYWSQADGFHDLGSLVNGGLAAQGWQYLADVYGSSTPGAAGTAPNGSPQYVLGDGFITGQTGGNSVYLLNGPTSLIWTNASVNGMWDLASSNWNTGFSTTVFQTADVVTLNDNNGGGGNYNITLNMVVTPGSVTVNNSAGNYTIGGTGGISGPGSLAKLGSSKLTLNTVNTYTGGTTVSAGMLIVGVNGALPDASVAINGAGTLQLGAGTGLAQMTSLSITGGGVLDVNNNHFILTYGSNDPISTIAAYIKSGYNGGLWNGAGINSTAAAINHGYGLGFADGADNVVASLPSGQIEVKYTLYGDANLDGVVNGTDFGILAAHFGTQVSGWDRGDFNYDGVVNGSDFGELAANFGQQADGADVQLPASDFAALDAFAAANGLMADVPEPASNGVVVAVVFSAISRRHRRVQQRVELNSHCGLANTQGTRA
jgi:fibronectin-binding autotransporter adhesin